MLELRPANLKHFHLEANLSLFLYLFKGVQEGYVRYSLLEFDDYVFGAINNVLFQGFLFEVVLLHNTNLGLFNERRSQ